MSDKWLVEEIDTPAVLIHDNTLQKNIDEMALFANRYDVQLRPHIKTHKIIEIAKRQIQSGAIGITTAKLGEAEVMAEHGIRDILIAYPMVGLGKLNRLMRLKKVASVMTVVDGWEQAEALSQFAVEHGTQFDILVEVDTGLKRCGVLPGEPTLALLQRLSSLPGIRVGGIMTHAGHAYGAPGPDQVVQIGEEEGRAMIETSLLVESHGLATPIVSVGSTPTARISGAVPGVTEIRPGNYVFNDMTQVRLGAATIADCSLRVAARIVSKPTADRLIIDAGAKTLALDQGAHGTTGVKGYGYVIDHPELTISRLSEEHGIVDIVGPTKAKVGDIIEIIPNHSCPVVNLSDQVWVVKDGLVTDSWKVAARGKTT